MKLKDVLGSEYLKSIGCYILRADEDTICRYDIGWTGKTPRSIIFLVEKGKFEAKITSPFFNAGFGNTKPSDIDVVGDSFDDLRLKVVEVLHSNKVLGIRKFNQLINGIKSGVI